MLLSLLYFGLTHGRPVTTLPDRRRPFLLPVVGAGAVLAQIVFVKQCLLH